MVRIRVHANGHPSPTYLLKIPGSWAELVAAASERVGGASSSLMTTRLFLSADGAEIGSVEDLEEGDVVSVALDGGAHCPADAVASVPPPQLQQLPPPAGATSGMIACTTIASGIVKGMHKGAELLDDARRRGDTAEICNLLRQLARAPAVSRDLLAETGVGVVVGKLKRHEDEDVASMARQLVEHWKAMLELEVSSGMSGPGVVERQLELELEQLQARRKREAARAAAIAREAALADTEAKRAARAALEARAVALAREAARADARARQAAEAEEEAREAVRAEAEARERRAERSLHERRGERWTREQAAKEHVESQVREAAERREAERREAERRKAERCDEHRAALEAERQEAERQEAEAEAEEHAAHEAKRKAAEREEADAAERLAALQRRATTERRTAREAAREAEAREAAVGEAEAGAEAEAEADAFEERLRLDQAEAAREVRRRHRSKTPATRASSRGRGRPSRIPGERIAIAGSLIENYAMDTVEGVRSEACIGGRHRRGAPDMAPERGSVVVSGCDGSSVGAAGATLDHPTTRRADGPAARRPRLKAGDLVLGAPLRQGRRAEHEDYGLGLVLAASDTAYSTRFMWRYPLGSAGNGAPVGVCDNLCIDRRDLRPASISRVKSTPPPPYLPSDRDILEGGQLAAEAAGFRWRRLESDVTDALGLEPPQPGVYS